MNTTSIPDTLITITECAAICGCSEQSIMNWMKSKEFPSPIAEGRPNKWSELAVLEWAAKHAIRTAKIVRR
jgi:predicted DNA-binding transcriptional regulator AlpA